MIKGFRCPDGTKAEVGTCLSKCASPCLPQPIIKSIWEDIKDNQANRHPAGMISVSALIGCSVEWALKQTAESWIEPTNLVSPWRGTAIHAAIGEQEMSSWKLETSFSLEFTRGDDTVTVSGTPDAYDEATMTLWDWKCPADLSLAWQPSKDHIVQTNIYRLMMEKAGLLVNRIRIGYITGKGVFTTPGDYTVPGIRKPVRMQEIPLMGSALLLATVEAQAWKLYDLYHGNTDITTVHPEGPPMFNGKKCASYCQVNRECPHYNPEERK